MPDFLEPLRLVAKATVGKESGPICNRNPTQKGKATKGKHKEEPKWLPEIAKFSGSLGWEAGNDPKVVALRKQKRRP